jgi:hypothetical protein
MRSQNVQKLYEKWANLLFSQLYCTAPRNVLSINLPFAPTEIKPKVFCNAISNLTFDI